MKVTIDKDDLIPLLRFCFENFNNKWKTVRYGRSPNNQIVDRSADDWKCFIEHDSHVLKCDTYIGDFEFEYTKDELLFKLTWC